MKPSNLPEVKATIEAIWNLAEVWGQSEFPLSWVLANLHDHLTDAYSETPSPLFLAFQNKFIEEYADDSIRGLALKPQSSLRIVVNCPSIVGLESLSKFKNQSWMVTPAEYILDPSFCQKPQRMHVEICVRQEMNNIMIYTSANSTCFDPSPDEGSVYTPNGECNIPNNSLALIRRFADFLFFTPRMSAYLNANEMGKIGPIYSALMSMASKIDGTAEHRPVTDEYSSTIDSVMGFAKMYHSKKGIQPKAFNSFLGQGADAMIIPLFRSKNGTKTSRDPRDYDTPRDWQDYQENRHRPKIRLKGYDIDFVPNLYSCSSDFYEPSTSKDLPFPSSVYWNYQSSRFLFASAKLAAWMMYDYKLPDLDRLRETAQVATQLVADLSKFEVSFAKFFWRELTVAML
ncbi:hypothetical protein [Candidatus Cryosericum hinesii]|jgi:hypothetical protein|nr:hypothetical protein [Candidatus Cryosericum hinesii]RIE10135.1 hypothetical protein SMC4_02950 [Candidatus Cryosericum hinesii]